MRVISIIIIYVSLSAIEMISLRGKKQKKESIIFIFAMIMPFILSINIAVGTTVPNINSIIRKLIWPVIMQFWGK